MIGLSTLREHFYADNIGKHIRYLEPPIPANRYFMESYEVGMDWLIGQQRLGRFADGITLIDRRTWFREDRS